MSTDKITISKGILISMLGIAVTALITVSWAFLNQRITHLSCDIQENKTLNKTQDELILNTLLEVRSLSQSIKNHLDREAG